MSTDSTADQKLHILVVAAHPHDFTHCAGTCGIHVKRGDRVTVVCVSDGRTTHNERLHDEMMKPTEERDPAIINQPPDEYVRIKADEFRAVCALFGVTDVRIFPYPDHPFSLAKYPQAAEQLRDVIYEIRPQVLIAHRPYLGGPHGLPSAVENDHIEATLVAHEAARLANKPDVESGQRPHSIAATYHMGIYFMPDEIDFYVDITEWYEQRVQAEILFASQSHTPAYARKRIEIGAGVMGWSCGVGYAEGYVRAMPELLPRIIVPEIALRRAVEPRVNRMKRVAGEQK